jgi:hypothetical protein
MYVHHLEISLTSSASSLIGSQEINNWVDLEADSVFIIQVTEGTCFPVSLINVTLSNNFPNVIQNFWNVVPDVPAFIFDLPSECSSANTVRIISGVTLCKMALSRDRMEDYGNCIGDSIATL